MAASKTVNYRVELKPHLDLWMRGARYGTAVKVTARKIHVHVDALNKVVRFDHDDVTDLGID